MSKPVKISIEWMRDNHFPGGHDNILCTKYSNEHNKMADDIEEYMKINHPEVTQDRQEYYWNHVAKGYRSKYPTI